MAGLPGAFCVALFDEVDHQRNQQQGSAGLRTGNDRPHRHNQMQQVADPADGLQVLGPLVLGLHIGEVICHGCQPFSSAARASALRRAFSSIPLVPSRRASSLTTSAGLKP